MPRNDIKAYTSLTARIPQDLADQVKRYASAHRCTISELIRDGLEMRLDTDLPWHAPGASRNAASEVLPEVLHALDALTPMLRALVQETVRAAMTEVLPEVLHRETSKRAAIPEVLHEVLPDDGEVLQEVLPSGDQVLHGHTSALQAPSGAPNRGMTEVVHGHTSAIPAEPAARTARRGMTKAIPSPAPPAQSSLQGMPEVLPFDTNKYRLGKLCPRNHDYHGTGQSLRMNNRSSSCRACDAEQKRERRQARRQEVSA